MNPIIRWLHLDFVFLTTSLCEREWEEKKLTGLPPAARQQTDRVELVLVCYDVDNMASASAALSRPHTAHSVHSVKGSLNG